MAYTTIDNPELYFQCKIYTGNATDDTAITLDGDENMQPDLVWIKDRTNANHHRIYDAVRGATKVIYSSLTSTEATASDGVKSFDSDGFTLGDGSDENGSSANMAAWNWKANGSGSADNNGSINSTATSANTTSGFSIVVYEGNSTSGATVGHGLGAVPHFIINKNIDNDSQNWQTYHVKVGNDKTTELDTTNASSGSSAWNSTTPTSTLFTLGNGVSTNGATQVAYCWTEKKGFSKFGSYVANADDDGPFVYCGFRPAWILCRSSSASGEAWAILDNKRNTFNPVLAKLFPNTNSAESATAGDNNVDFLSNGFKIITNDNGLNKSGVTFIFAAFAEAPFVNSNGVPCNAR